MILAIPLAAASADETDVKAAAASWLALVDEQKYGDSWNAASPYFRSQIAEAAWEQAIKAARGPLGAVTSRALSNDTRAASLPGAPDGDYEVLQYRSQFADKASAIETLTLMHDAGDWKVAGYFIR
jgi:hypothetical protein